MPWYRVYKTYRGGKSDYDYIEVPNRTPLEAVQDDAEYWAENTSGGHNYGWTVYWKKVRKPPKKWIQDKIYNLKDDIVQYYKAIESIKIKIEKLKKMLN